MMYSNVIVGIAISGGSFVFSPSHVKVSASHTNVGSLAVGAFDLVNCSLTISNGSPPSGTCCTDLCAEKKTSKTYLNKGSSRNQEARGRGKPNAKVAKLQRGKSKWH